jgi:hypothetical protein
MLNPLRETKCKIGAHEQPFGFAGRESDVAKNVPAGFGDLDPLHNCSNPIGLETIVVVCGGSSGSIDVLPRGQFTPKLRQISRVVGLPLLIRLLGRRKAKIEHACH